MTERIDNKSGVRALNDEEIESYQTWRLMAFSKAPYYSTILYALRPVSAKIGTMGVDKHLRVYIDFDQAAQWGDEACSQVLLHECGHIIGEHAKLGESLGISGDYGRAKMLNIAGDMSINDDLADMGMDFIASTGVMPSSIGAPDYLAAIEYYDLLSDLVDKNKPEQGHGKQGLPSDESGSGQDGDSQSNDEPGEVGEGEEPQPGDDFDHSQGCGSIAHGIDAPWDLGSDDLDGQATPASDAEIIRITDQAKHAEQEWAGKNPGRMTAGVRNSTRESGRSNVHWTARVTPVASNAIASSGPRSKISYRRVNRRFHPRIGGRRVLLPSRTPKSLNVGAIMDTSGSMVEDHKKGRVLREVAGIHQKVVAGRGSTFVLDADTEVHEIREYKGKGSITDMVGCGGTAMEKVIIAALCDERLRRGPKEIGALFVITDGETAWPRKEEVPRAYANIPVVAVIINKRKMEAPEWIHSVHIYPSELKD